MFVTKSWWVKVFFITFYIFSVVLTLNLLVAFMLDLHISEYQSQHNFEKEIELKRLEELRKQTMESNDSDDTSSVDSQSQSQS